MINVHASVLPRYRGAAPIHRAVMAGDAETGVVSCLPACDQKTVYRAKELESHDIKLGMRWMFGAPVVAELPFDPAVARSVDAGLLASRLPRSVAQPLRAAV